MALAPGTRLGVYEITAQIGAGGMGEVYRATDTRLDRTVAIKVLPEHFASDGELTQRFEREARTLAALSHPHICPVFDVGNQSGIDFLVMEHFEGETLEHRLKKGALPLGQALQIGIQIADALRAAHRAGIVHRDLKPGNIILTKSGAKLLDFGLAKTGAPAIAGSLSMMPTTPPNLTAQGTILGTFQYMAPEQLEGQEADVRTDIFAFGSVMYEMLTGKKAFDGKSQASLISAILKDDPRPMSTLQPLAPPLLDRIVAKSLAKEPDSRWQSAADLGDELQWVARAPALATAPHVAKRGGTRLAWTIAALSLVMAALAIATGWSIASGPAGPAAPETRLEATMPGRFEDWVAISPDGRLLVSGGLADGRWQLWLRPLDSITARPLAGTEGAVYPFWAPDSRSIAFFAEGKLKRIDVAGGPAQTLANAREPRGGTWAPDGTIIFAPTLYGGLSRISSSGGDSRPLTQLSNGQRSHRFPSFLPDGLHFLYFDTATGTYLGALDGSAPKHVTPNVDSAMLYTPPGVLLFVRQRTLMAQPFSLDTFEMTGDPSRVAELTGLTGAVNTGSLSVSASAHGTIAFRGASGVQSGGTRLAWFDRSGKEVGSVGAVEGFLVDVDLSSDGSHLVTTRSPNRALGGLDVWIMEMKRGVWTRLTSDPATDQMGIWSPNGERVVFNSNRKGTLDLYEAPFNSSGAEKLLLELPGTTVATDWSSDARFILYNELSPTSGYDLWALPLFGDRKPLPIANREFDELSGKLSRDMRWVAYESNEGERFEIVVQAFRDPTAKWQISSGGGMLPRWRADGRELFYVASDGTLMAVPITPSHDGGTLQPGPAVPLVRNRVVFDAYRGIRNSRYAVTPDGQRFLMIVPAEEVVAPVVVILNWAGGVAN